MQIAFVSVQGQQYGTRVDADTAVVVGDYTEYTTLDKENVASGKTRIPTAKIVSVRIPRV